MMMRNRKLEVARLYTETARGYAVRYGEIQAEKHELVLSRLPERIGRLLDVGCGMGELLARLGKRASVAVGVDISPGMVRALGKRRPRVIVADADRLPFADGSFDCVVSVTLLQNMPDPRRTVAEMKRVVRPGGLVIVTTLRKKHSLRELLGIVRSAGLLVRESGEIGEDVYCVCERPHHNG